MDTPNIRRATTDDQEALVALWTAFMDEQANLEVRLTVAEDAEARWRNDVPVWLEDETCRLFVAEADETVVGFATARRWGPPPVYAESEEVYLDEIYVHPDHRRAGMGAQLAAAVRAWAEELGAERLRLRMLEANEASRAFWEAQSARPLSVSYTMELEPSRDEDKADEGSKKIGF